MVSKLLSSNEVYLFISQLSTENWVGNQNQGTLEQAINWQQIKLAIADLDAHQKILVLLETDGETHMAVGGGLGRYVVYVTFDNENFHYSNPKPFAKSNCFW